MGRLDFLWSSLFVIFAVHGTCRGLLQHHSLKLLIFLLSTFFIGQLSQLHNNMHQSVISCQINILAFQYSIHTHPHSVTQCTFFCTTITTLNNLQSQEYEILHAFTHLTVNYFDIFIPCSGHNLGFLMCKQRPNFSPSSVILFIRCFRPFQFLKGGLCPCISVLKIIIVLSSNLGHVTDISDTLGSNISFVNKEFKGPHSCKVNLVNLFTGKLIVANLVTKSL